jgi:hypothetical protein
MPRVGYKVALDLASPVEVLFLPCDDPLRTNRSLSSRTSTARDSGSFHPGSTSHIQDENGRSKRSESYRPSLLSRALHLLLSFPPTILEREY